MDGRGGDRRRSTFSGFERGLVRPLQLARRYIETLSIPNVAFSRFEDLPIDGQYDLVISCYGLSELSRQPQVMYLQRVLLKARAGYLLWNNFQTNFNYTPSITTSTSSEISYHPVQQPSTNTTRQVPKSFTPGEVALIGQF